MRQPVCPDHTLNPRSAGSPRSDLAVLTHPDDAHEDRRPFRSRDQCASTPKRCGARRRRATRSSRPRRSRKGLLIVHTGKGKGKSTAAFGLVFRALGNGMKVAIVQFVKGKWQTGERVALEKFGDQVSINTMGEGFTWETQDSARDIEAAKAAWEKAKALIADQRARAGRARRAQHRAPLRLSRCRRSGGRRLLRATP